MRSATRTPSASGSSASSDTQSCLYCAHARHSTVPSTIACMWLTQVYGEMVFGMAAAKLKRVFSGIGYPDNSPVRPPGQGAPTAGMILVNASDRCPKWDRASSR